MKIINKKYKIVEVTHNDRKYFWVVEKIYLFRWLIWVDTVGEQTEEDMLPYNTYPEAENKVKELQNNGK